MIKQPLVQTISLKAQIRLSKVHIGHDNKILHRISEPAVTISIWISAIAHMSKAAVCSTYFSSKLNSRSYQADQDSKLAKLGFLLLKLIQMCLRPNFQARFHFVTSLGFHKSPPLYLRLSWCFRVYGFKHNFCSSNSTNVFEAVLPNSHPSSFCIFLLVIKYTRKT
jgi:hypothetical protein